MDAWLPRLAVDLDTPAPSDLARLFPPPVRSCALEIGFGGGEHLLSQARANPDIGYIGCEPFEDGVAKVVTAIAEEGLSNIRIHADDARQLLDWAPEGAFERAYILFPDPWPKARHAKRRLIQPAFLAALVPKLAGNARLRFATDIPAYLVTALRAFRADGRFTWTATRAADWRERPDDWPQTRYERKALREGRRCYYLTLEKTDRAPSSY